MDNDGRTTQSSATVSDNDPASPTNPYEISRPWCGCMVEWFLENPDKDYRDWFGDDDE